MDIDLFVLVSIIVSFGLIPMLLTARPAPAFETSSSMPLPDLYRASPLAVIASGLTGVAWHHLRISLGLRQYCVKRRRHGGAFCGRLFVWWAGFSMANGVALRSGVTSQHHGDNLGDGDHLLCGGGRTPNRIKRLSPGGGDCWWCGDSANDAMGNAG